MTSTEQYIYNCYLETSRKINSQPFRYRKNFENFEDKEEYIYISRLSVFFKKFPNINVKDFFEAPYFVYNEKYFDLKYFASQKAIKAYTVYQTKFLVDNPDNEQTLLKIKDSFMYIYNFCKENNITFDNYTSSVKTENKWHDFLIHIKERNVLIYCMFVFPNFDKIISQYDREIKEFTFGETFNNLNFYRTKYHSSDKAKKLCIAIFDKLNSKLTNL